MVWTKINLANFHLTLLTSIWIMCFLQVLHFFHWKIRILLILPQLFSVGNRVTWTVSSKEIRFHQKHYFSALLSGRSWVPSGNDAAIRMIWSTLESDLLLTYQSSWNLPWQLSTAPFLMSPSCVPFRIST